jgi:hypothetical protein
MHEMDALGSQSKAKGKLTLDPVRVLKKVTGEYDIFQPIKSRRGSLSGVHPRPQPHDPSTYMNIPEYLQSINR